MRLKYSPLSAGYLGRKATTSTLSSGFFFHLWENPLLWDEPQPFPQRIPRTGFFTELIRLEGRTFKTELDRRIFSLTKRLRAKPSPEVTMNVLRALTRYGALAPVIKFSAPATCSSEEALEYGLIVETAKMSAALSAGETPNLDGFLRLVSAAPAPEIPEAKIVAALTLFVASSFRYYREGKIRERAQEMNQKLLRLLDKPPTHFADAVFRSMAFRAAAMDPALGAERQSSLLVSAAEVGEGAKATTTAQELVKKENLLTLHQTQSKWALFRKDSAGAKRHLEEMIALDPVDSVGHSELGIYLFNEKNWSGAQAAFTRAISLGPSGVGMNHYFLAKTLQAEERRREALKHFRLATETDPEGISAWLELFDFYTSQKRKKDARWVAQKVLRGKTLVAQLTPEEKARLKS